MVDIISEFRRSS